MFRQYDGPSSSGKLTQIRQQFFNARCDAKMSLDFAGPTSVAGIIHQSKFDLVSVAQSAGIGFRCHELGAC